MRSHAKTCKRIRSCKSLTTVGTAAAVLQLDEHVLIARAHQMLLIRVMMHVHATLRVSHPCIEADCIALQVTRRHWNAVAHRQCENSRDGSGADTMSHTRDHASEWHAVHEGAGGCTRLALQRGHHHTPTQCMSVGAGTATIEVILPIC
jgi:hypothetical protein